jgi:hypothetical protein
MINHDKIPTLNISKSVRILLCLQIPTQSKYIVFPAQIGIRLNFTAYTDVTENNGVSHIYPWQPLVYVKRTAPQNFPVRNPHSLQAVARTA